MSGFSQFFQEEAERRADEAEREREAEEEKRQQAQMDMYLTMMAQQNKDERLGSCWPPTRGFLPNTKRFPWAESHWVDFSSAEASVLRTARTVEWMSWQL